MQHRRPWRELSWQAIQKIVGVKLSVDVLRFDDLSWSKYDSDVEIIEDDTDNESSPPPPATVAPASPAAPVTPAASHSGGSSPAPAPLSEPDGPASPPTPPGTDPSPPIGGDDGDNALSIDDYLEVTLYTDPEPSSPHPCSACDRTFSTVTELDSHACPSRESAPPDVEQKKHGCHVCSEKFPTYWELRRHINSHFPGMLDSKSSFCHLCQKDYTKTGFMNHLRKHTGERPFVCELCRKAFSQSSSLSIHMKFHLNVRKHVCTVCDKKFVTKSELSRHMTVHTKQKSYYCGVCDKAFTRSDNMKKHEKTHG